MDNVGKGSTVYKNLEERFRLCCTSVGAGSELTRINDSFLAIQTNTLLIYTLIYIIYIIHISCDVRSSEKLWFGPDFTNKVYLALYYNNIVCSDF